MESAYSLQMLQQQLQQEFEILKKINRTVSSNLEINPIFNFEKLHSGNKAVPQPAEDTMFEDFTNLSVVRGHIQLSDEEAEEEDEDEDVSEEEEDVYEDGDAEEEDMQFSSVIQGNLSDLKNGNTTPRDEVDAKHCHNKQNIDELIKLSIDFLSSNLSSNLNLKDISHQLNLEFMNTNYNEDEAGSRFGENDNLQLLQMSSDEDAIFISDKLNGVKISELSNSINVKSKLYISELENY